MPPYPKQVGAALAVLHMWQLAGVNSSVVKLSFLLSVPCPFDCSCSHCHLNTEQKPSPPAPHLIRRYSEQALDTDINQVTSTYNVSSCHLAYLLGRGA